MEMNYITPAIDNKCTLNTESIRSTSRKNMNITQVDFISTVYNCSILECIWYLFQFLFRLYEQLILSRKI